MSSLKRNSGAGQIKRKSATQRIERERRKKRD
jgi:hypothetical protein